MIDLKRLIPVRQQLRHEWWSSVLRTSISSQIKELRGSRGWTQSELGKRIGGNQSFVANLENPNFKHPPSIKTLLRIAEVFDVALIVRFDGWGKAVAFLADDVIPLPYEQERQLPQIRSDS
jgi:transcriptional regulator with XRE-family HTH domain